MPELDSVGTRSLEHQVAISKFSPIVRRPFYNIKQMDEHKKTKGHSKDILRKHHISQCIIYFSLIFTVPFSYTSSILIQ